MTSARRLIRRVASQLIVLTRAWLCRGPCQLSPTFPICRLLSHRRYAVPTRKPRLDGSSQPLTPRRTALRARGSGLSRCRTVFGRSWTHLSRRGGRRRRAGRQSANRTWVGLAQLRANRMNPQGVAPFVRARSASSSVHPAIPTIAAVTDGLEPAAANSAAPQRRMTKQLALRRLSCSHRLSAASWLANGPICTR